MSNFAESEEMIAFKGLNGLPEATIDLWIKEVGLGKEVVFETVKQAFRRGKPSSDAELTQPVEGRELHLTTIAANGDAAPYEMLEGVDYEITARSNGVSEIVEKGRYLPGTTESKADKIRSASQAITLLFLLNAGESEAAVAESGQNRGGFKLVSDRYTAHHYPTGHHQTRS